jgi:hypothetical protein
MKQYLFLIIILVSKFTFSQNVLWSDDFNSVSNWTMNNSGQSGLEYGWNINNSSEGWWSPNGVNSTSGGNQAELVNGDPSIGTQALNVVYTLTNSTPVYLNNLNGLNNIFLQFQQFGARFNDLQEIQISTDGSNFVTVNNNLNFPVYTSAGGNSYPNPDLKITNISQYITSTTTPIWVRFQWTTNFPGIVNGNVWITYGWYIDDVKIVQVNNQPIPVTQTINEFTCGSYTSPTNQIYTQSGIYNEVIQNIYGFDSLIYTINLTVSNAFNTINSSICSGSNYWLNGTSYNQPGQFTQILQSSQGCDSTITLNLTVAPPLSSFINASICSGALFTLNGVNYSTGGTYSQLFQTQNGCDSMVTLNLTVLPTNFNPIFSSNQQLFTSPPFAVQFSNTTANIGNYNFTWFWGDGTSTTSNNPTVFHEYLSNGLYTVTLQATNTTTGCTDESTYTDYIFTTGGVSCTHTATINQTGPINSCSGQPIILTCNSDPNFTYQWRNNGIYIPGNNNDSLIVTQSGSYSVIISVNGCPVASTSVTVNFQSITQPTITSSGTIQPCIGGSVTLSASSGYSGYLWSNGASSPSIIVNTSGNYTVQATGSNGCTSTSAPYTINASFLPTQNICVVGVDSLTNNIRVVWEEPITTAIDSFYIYKESNVSNVYTQVGSRAYDSLSVWIDPISNPAVQSYRYKITALDTCGVETPVSDFHKTIHLTINQGVGGAWNLIWSHYEGINFGSYNIYRGTSSGNMTLLTTIQSNLNSYTDLAPPSGAVYYQIEIVNPTNCTPTKSTNYSSSKSNIATNDLNAIEEFSSEFISVYPNPTSSDVTIEITKGLIGEEFNITDYSGRILKTGNFDSSKQKIDFSDFSNGVYFIQITSRNIQQRIIKN